MDKALSIKLELGEETVTVNAPQRHPFMRYGMYT